MSRLQFSKKSTVVLASAARTTTGQSGAFDVGSQDFLTVLINTTAASGTPSMVVNVEWSHDGSTWCVADTADAFTAITGTANGSRVKRFEVKGLYARLNYVISGGTPSLTFSAHAITGS